MAGASVYRFVPQWKQTAVFHAQVWIHIMYRVDNRNSFSPKGFDEIRVPYMRTSYVRDVRIQLTYALLKLIGLLNAKSLS